MFTVAALKEKLRQMTLSTAGNKAELILRLNQTDPSGQWISDIDADVNVTVEDSGDAATIRDVEPSERVIERQSELSSDRDREAELARRDLMLREMEFMRRENEHLRAMAQAIPGNSCEFSDVQSEPVKFERDATFDGKKGFY